MREQLLIDLSFNNDYDIGSKIAENLIKIYTNNVLERKF